LTSICSVESKEEAESRCNPLPEPGTRTVEAGAAGLEHLTDTQKAKQAGDNILFFMYYIELFHAGLTSSVSFFRMDVNVKPCTYKAMKTLFVAPFLLLVVLTGCFNDPVSAPPSAPEPSAAKMVAEMRGGEQRLAFQTLTPTERKSLWLSKIDTRTQDSGLTLLEKELLAELRAFAALQTYEDNRPPAETEKINGFEDKWLARAKEIWTPTEIYELAYSLGGDIHQDVAALPGNNCICNQGSDFTCPDYSIGGDVIIGITWGNCYSSGCPLLCNGV
jgi:hypothetical protein